MKKHCLFVLAALAMFGCSEPEGNSNPNSNTGTSKCGDGILNKADGEVCDTKIPVSCSAVDSSKTWKDGGNATCATDCKSISIGTCEEIQNLCGTVDAKCSKGDTKSCAEFDSTKNWKDGGNATCADDCGSFVIGTCVEETCGNTILDVGEKCDIALAYTCIAYDPNIEWKPGGVPVCKSDCSDYEIGTCVPADETVNTSKCGTADAKCSKDEELTCDKFDNTKTWQDGGKAACAEDCSAVLIGTCEEATEPATLCGTANAKCSKGEELTCDKFDNNKVWKDGGKAACDEDCSAILKGSCEEVECTKTEDCSNDKICADNKCVDAPACGNQKLDVGETCEFEGTKACKDVDAKWGAGTATCTDCQLDDSQCTLNETKAGLYHCQLINPVAITFTPSHKSETVNVRYTIGMDVNEPDMQAELVYGTDFKTMEKWKTIPATQNADKDVFTATLQDTNVLSTGGDKAHYTFRVKTSSDADWQYCKRNNPDQYADADIIDPDLKPYTLKEGDHNDSNVHETGTATVSTLETSNIIAEFNFDDITKATGNAVSYTADIGNGIITNEDNAWCNGNECYVNGVSGKSISLKNWKTAKEDAVDSYNNPLAAHISISSLNTTGATGINLDMQVRRNAEESPDKIVVVYTTDGETYAEGGEISLNKDSQNVQKFLPYSLELPSGVNNQSTLTLVLIPYGGNGLLRFDNIVISKGN